MGSLARFYKPLYTQFVFRSDPAQPIQGPSGEPVRSKCVPCGHSATGASI